MKSCPLIFNVSAGAQARPGGMATALGTGTPGHEITATRTEATNRARAPLGLGPVMLSPSELDRTDDPSRHRATCDEPGLEYELAGCAFGGFDEFWVTLDGLERRQVPKSL